MLAGRLISLVSRSPAGKRWLWRAWYQFLAQRYRDPRWTFMNYGYRAGRPLTLDPADEDDRSCMQLYETVATGAPLVGRDVLEVGCGRGGGAAFVARYHQPRRMVGVDVSPRAVALCRDRFPLPALSFAVGDAERLPFDDASFDVVLNVESSHCYGDLAAFFSEVRRVLRPGGHFVYADFRPTPEVAAWRDALDASGFARLAERDLTSGVIAALDADDARKRSMIARLIDRPLAGLFHQFAGLRGTELYDDLRSGAFSYLAFTLS